MLHTIALHLIECKMWYINVRYEHLHGKLVLCDLTYHFSGCKMQGQFHCNGYMYDNSLFGDFDTVAYKVQLDNNYSAL